MSLQPEHEHHLVSKDFVASTVLENLASIRTRMIDKQEFECAYAAKAGIDLITALRADLAAARADAEWAKADAIDADSSRAAFEARNLDLTAKLGEALEETELARKVSDETSADCIKNYNAAVALLKENAALRAHVYADCEAQLAALSSETRAAKEIWLKSHPDAMDGEFIHWLEDLVRESEARKSDIKRLLDIIESVNCHDGYLDGCLEDEQWEVIESLEKKFDDAARSAGTGGSKA
jgi:hypothetical protein